MLIISGVCCFFKEESLIPVKSGILTVVSFAFFSMAEIDPLSALLLAALTGKFDLEIRKQSSDETSLLWPFISEPYECMTDYIDNLDEDFLHP